MKKLYGIVCANITPMYGDGEIDLQSLEHLVCHMRKTGIHGVYELDGDYYIPCIALSEFQADCDIGMWGRKHLNYLKEYHPVRYTALMLNGELGTYLTELNHQAKERFDILTAQMAKAQGVNEQLKVKDQMAWVGAMNNIRSAATEIMEQELIFV